MPELSRHFHRDISDNLDNACLDLLSSVPAVAAIVPKPETAPNGEVHAKAREPHNEA